MVPYLIGRTADVVASHYGVSTVSFPTMEFDKDTVYANAVELPESGPGAPLWREMLRYAPGGLAHIDPRSVASRSGAKRYTTLPQEAGLAQLLDEGGLQIIGFTMAVMLGRTQVIVSSGADKIVAPEGVSPEVIAKPSKFLITKKIRFPAGLNGAHSVEFVLGVGVPEPDGSPGHSKILKLDAIE